MELLRKLTEIRYERNDVNFTRNTFRVRGDTVEIYPTYWAGRGHPRRILRRRD